LLKLAIVKNLAVVTLKYREILLKNKYGIAELYTTVFSLMRVGFSLSLSLYLCVCVWNERYPISELRVKSILQYSK
jgi:hypothetical protein